MPLSSDLAVQGTIWLFDLSFSAHSPETPACKIPAVSQTQPSILQGSDNCIKCFHHICLYCITHILWNKHSLWQATLFFSGFSFQTPVDNLAVVRWRKPNPESCRGLSSYNSPFSAFSILCLPNKPWNSFNLWLLVLQWIPPALVVEKLQQVIHLQVKTWWKLSPERLFLALWSLGPVICHLCINQRHNFITNAHEMWIEVRSTQWLMIGVVIIHWDVSLLNRWSQTAEWVQQNKIKTFGFSKS